MPIDVRPTPPRYSDLAGRSVLVLGAASDMGAAMARAFAADDAVVWLADLRADRCRAVADEITAGGRRARSETIDVTRSQDVEALVDRVETTDGRLDVVINLAGIIADARVLETTPEVLDRILAVNVGGVFNGCRAAGRVMVARGSGSIINMASLGAFTPIPGLGAYGMSKAAVVSLTRTLAAELGPSGVRVNAIAPGYVEGGMTARHARSEDGRIDEAKMAPIRERMARRSPLGLAGVPEDIVPLALHLASDASRYVTGQVLHANGGTFMP